MVTTAATDAADKTQILSSNGRGRRRHSAMIVPRAFRAREPLTLLFCDPVRPAASSAHFSMAGALMELRIPHGPVRQFDRIVIFYRNRLATFAVFAQRASARS